MGIIFRTEKRRVIPKWRSFEVATATGELNMSSKSPILVSINSDFLKEQKLAFSNNKDVARAGDLLSAAYVLGIGNEFKDVAKFVLEKENNSTLGLIRIAQEILNIDQEKWRPLGQSGETTKYETRYKVEINRYRTYLAKEPRNAIAWIELARLYALIGKISKAKRSIDAALSLDHNNRFIVRSASRFYNHYKSDNEAALGIIKRSDFIKTDPWLMSAEIAYSTILERQSMAAKNGVKYIENQSSNSVEITELASAIGTLEYDHGKLKIAKKYFNKSLIHPNDNSIAQVKWISDGIQGFDFDVAKYNIPLAFEANAIAALETKQYGKSLDHSLKWINDELYSTRPVQLASYIASVFLSNNEQGIELLKTGLLYNPDDIMLNNNLVYFLLRDNRLDEAKRIFTNKLLKELRQGDNSLQKLTVTATAGLILYRDGNREEGKALYKRAINLAKKTDNEYLVALATVNYAKEEAKFIEKRSEVSPQIKYLEKYCKNFDSPDVNIFFNELIEQLKKVKAE